MIEANVTALGDEDRRLRAVARACGEDGASGELSFFPVGSVEKMLGAPLDAHVACLARSEMTEIFVGEVEVSGAVAELVGLRVEGQAMLRDGLPVGAVVLQLSFVGQSPLDLRCRGEDDTACGVGA